MTKRIQRSFSGGEVSPFVYPLTGIHKRVQGLAKAKNVIVKKFGAVENRPGTEFIELMSAQSRIVEFIDSGGGGHLIMLSHRRIRILDTGLLEREGSIRIPLSWEQLKRSTFSQQADRLVITSNFAPPMELVRNPSDPSLTPGDPLTSTP